MSKFLNNKLFRYLAVFLFLNSKTPLLFSFHAAKALEDLSGGIAEFKNKKTDK